VSVKSDILLQAESTQGHDFCWIRRFGPAACRGWVGPQRGAQRSASGLVRTPTGVPCGITLSDGDWGRTEGLAAAGLGLVEAVIGRRAARSMPPSLKAMPHEFERRLLATAACGEPLPASGAQASLRSAFGWAWRKAGVIRSLNFVQGHPCVQQAPEGAPAGATAPVTRGSGAGSTTTRAARSGGRRRGSRARGRLGSMRRR
jgi:hypothetical protein